MLKDFRAWTNSNPESVFAINEDILKGALALGKAAAEEFNKLKKGGVIKGVKAITRDAVMAAEKIAPLKNIESKLASNNYERELKLVQNAREQFLEKSKDFFDRDRVDDVLEAMYSSIIRASWDAIQKGNREAISAIPQHLKEVSERISQSRAIMERVGRVENSISTWKSSGLKDQVINDLKEVTDDIVKSIESVNVADTHGRLKTEAMEKLTEMKEKYPKAFTKRAKASKAEKAEEKIAAETTQKIATPEESESTIKKAAEVLSSSENEAKKAGAVRSMLNTAGIDESAIESMRIGNLTRISQNQAQTGVKNFQELEKSLDAKYAAQLANFKEGFQAGVTAAKEVNKGQNSRLWPKVIGGLGALYGINWVIVWLKANEAKDNKGDAAKKAAEMLDSAKAFAEGSKSGLPLNMPVPETTESESVFSLQNIPEEVKASLPGKDANMRDIIVEMADKMFRLPFDYFKQIDSRKVDPRTDVYSYVKDLDERGPGGLKSLFVSVASNQVDEFLETESTNSRFCESIFMTRSSNRAEEAKKTINEAKEFSLAFDAFSKAIMSDRVRQEMKAYLDPLPDVAFTADSNDSNSERIISSNAGIQSTLEIVFRALETSQSSSSSPFKRYLSAKFFNRRSIDSCLMGMLSVAGSDSSSAKVDSKTLQVLWKGFMDRVDEEFDAMSKIDSSFAGKMFGSDRQGQYDSTTKQLMKSITCACMIDSFCKSLNEGPTRGTSAANESLKLVLNWSTIIGRR